MKKAFLTSALLLSVLALLPIAAHSNEGDGSVPNYSSWTLAGQTRVPVPVSGLKFPMQLLITVGTYVEDVKNNDSRYVTVFWVLGNPVVRRLSSHDNFQLLVNGVWQDCAVGAEPKVFLVTGGTEVKGVRLELPSADGKSVLKLEVTPLAKSPAEK